MYESEQSVTLHILVAHISLIITEYKQQPATSTRIRGDCLRMHMNARYLYRYSMVYVQGGCNSAFTSC